MGSCEHGNGSTKVGEYLHPVSEGLFNFSRRTLFYGENYSS